MKVETTYGTDIFAGTVAAADIMAVYGIAADPQVNMVDIPTMGATMGSLGGVPGTRIGRVSCEMMLRGVGSAYSSSVLPEADRLLRACGYAATLVVTGGAESVTYKPVSTGFEPFTIYVHFENAPTVKLAGCYGDCQIICQVGQPLRARFTFTGLYVTEADTPAIAAKVFSPTPQWPVLLSSLFQIGTENYAPNYSQVTFNTGNSIDVQEAANAASGIAGVFIGSRRMTGSIDPEMVTIAAFPWKTKLEGGTLMDMSFQTNGSQYARVKFSCPTVQMRTRGLGNRGMKGAYSIGFEALYVSGGDELSILFD
jgi:hypothetical protein